MPDTKIPLQQLLNLTSDLQGSVLNDDAEWSLLHYVDCLIGIK